MASGPRYAIKNRRRREGSTNYKRRLALLKSGKPRLVIRRSNKNIICQIVEYGRSGDKSLVYVNSNSLKKLGWKHSCKNLPAAYLTGYAAGLAAKKAEVKEAVLDHGLYDTTKGSKMYSALKGFVDAGLDIAHGKNIFPTDERLSGKHINKNVEKDFSAVKSKMK